MLTSFIQIEICHDRKDDSFGVDQFRKSSLPQILHFNPRNIITNDWKTNCQVPPPFHFFTTRSSDRWMQST